MSRFDPTQIPAEAWAELFPKQRVVLDIEATTIVRPPVKARPLTVVAVGAFRGGTSFLAEQLVECGVPMGERYVEVLPKANYISYEDSEIGPAIDKRDFKRLKNLFAERDKKHDLWGFKKPSSVFHIDTILPMLRNPHIIVIARDPLSCFQSGEAHGTVNEGDLSFKNCRGHFSLIMEIIEKPRCPTLAISYERSKANAPGLRIAIKEFLGL